MASQQLLQYFNVFIIANCSRASLRHIKFTKAFRIVCLCHVRHEKRPRGLLNYIRLAEMEKFQTSSKENPGKKVNKTPEILL